MNERIKQLARQAGGEFWQRIESDGVLNKEAYITFDPPQSLEKFAELIVKECAAVQHKRFCEHGDVSWDILMEHFGVEE